MEPGDEVGEGFPRRFRLALVAGFVGGALLVALALLLVVLGLPNLPNWTPLEWATLVVWGIGGILDFRVGFEARRLQHVFLEGPEEAEATQRRAFRISLVATFLGGVLPGLLLFWAHQATLPPSGQAADARAPPSSTSGGAGASPLAPLGAPPSPAPLSPRPSSLATIPTALAPPPPPLAASTATSPPAPMVLTPASASSSTSSSPPQPPPPGAAPPRIRIPGQVPARAKSCSQCGSPLDLPGPVCSSCRARGLG